MQPTKFDVIIDKTVETNKLNKDLLNKLSNFLFTKTKQKILNIDNLSVQFEGLVIFYYSKKRFERLNASLNEYLEGASFLPNFLKDKTREEITTYSEKVKKVLSDYEIFIQDKRRIKTQFKIDKQNEYQAKIQRLGECRTESSDNLEEYI